MPWVKPPWARSLNWIWCNFHILWRSLVHQSPCGYCRPNYSSVLIHRSLSVWMNEYYSLWHLTLYGRWRLLLTLWQKHKDWPLVTFLNECLLLCFSNASCSSSQFRPKDELLSSSESHIHHQISGIISPTDSLTTQSIQEEVSTTT